MSAGELLAGIGLVLVFEGLMYGGFPGIAKRLAFDVQRMPDDMLRIIGVGAIAIGVAIIWLVRG